MSEEQPAQPALLALPDVASRALGGAVMATDDDFFADVHTLIAAAAPVHDPLLFAPRGGGIKEA